MVNVHKFLFPFYTEERDNKIIMNIIFCSLRLDVDITELHSWITRSEAVLQSPEFAVYRKEGDISDLKEKVNVCSILYLLFFPIFCSSQNLFFQITAL